MSRHLASGLRLLACVWLLPVLGCTTHQEPVAKQPQGPAARHPNDPVGKRSDVPQPQTLSERALSLWERDIDSYRRNTKDPPAIRPQAEGFMRDVLLGKLPHPRGAGYANIAQAGKRLFEQGSQDALLRAYYGRAVCSDKGCLEAMPIFLESLNGWAQSGYPGEQRRMAIFTLFSEAKVYAKALDWPRLRKEAVWLAGELVRDETITAETWRLVFDELRPLLSSECGQNWEDAVAISEACSKEPNADPWIVHMLAGHAYVARAWHHRGADWAYKVTQEGWKLFGENLEKAAEEFVAAWKLHPDWPEASACMIQAAMGGASEQTPQSWFDQAVAAELDYMPAYAKLRWALRPRWGGSHEALYQFGCSCADTKRYDTMVPFVLLQALNDIDEERGFDCQAWRRDGVYARVKQVLEGMANEPSRADGDGLYPWRSALMGLHVALAERAGEYQEARRLADGLDGHFNRDLFNKWCGHPELVLASIYAFTGKGAADITAAWQTLDQAPKPFTNQTLETARSLFEKALAADDNERSMAYCRARLTEMDGRLSFNAGEWFERKFDPRLLCWLMTKGTWSQESENSAIGHARSASDPVCVRPFLVPLFPLEIEFDVEVVQPPSFPLTVGLFIPDGDRTGTREESHHQFFVRTRDNLAGIEISGDSKTVPCSLRPVNRIRVQLAEGRAVLYVNGQVCLDRREENFRPQPAFDFGCQDYLHPHIGIRVSNVRMRKWKPPRDEPAPKDEPAAKAA